MSLLPHNASENFTFVVNTALRFDGQEASTTTPAGPEDGSEWFCSFSEGDCGYAAE